MNDFPTEGDMETVAVDTADNGGEEDRYYDTLDDAMAALGDDEDGEAQESEPADDEPGDADGDEPSAAMVMLSDGTEISLGEIEKGYLRQSDYTRKTQEIAQVREDYSRREAELTQQAQHLEAASQALLARVQQLIPPAPSPALAQQNPAEYVRQMAIYTSAQTELAGWMADGGAAAEAVQQLTQGQIAQRKADANAELVKAMPKLKDPAAMAKFDADVTAAAAKFGFDEATIAATTDPRVRRMAYFAAIGMRAEENRRAAAQRVGAPKVGKPPAPAKHVGAGKKAMRRLSQTGSFKDALSVDF